MKKREIKATMTGVSLTDKERQLIKEASEKRGLYNFSAALRQIINEWAEMKQERDNNKSQADHA